MQHCVTRRQELIIVWRMVYCRRWTHLENRQQHRLRQLELKAGGRRTARVRQRKPFRPVMIAGRPEFSRSVPHSSMLLINTVLKKIVGAGLVRSMMEADGLWRCFFFGFMGTCHESPNSS